jgi:CubicO group peptidase (beta-lactamase class C family)
VRFSEEYSGRDDMMTLTMNTYRLAGTGGPSAVTPFNKRDAPPGTKFSYASAETQVLGLVLTRAVGRPVAEYLEQRSGSRSGPRPTRPGSSTTRGRR